MNPLLRSDFEQADKNFVKILRRKIIQQIIYIRKSNKLYDYKTIYNFSYLHIIFSLFFVLLPFVCFTFKLSEILANEKNNFLNSFLLEKFFKDNKKSFFINNYSFDNFDYNYSMSKVNSPFNQVYNFDSNSSDYTAITNKSPLNFLFKLAKTTNSSSLINFEYFLPQNQILNEFYYFEDFLWEHTSNNSNLQNIFSAFYLSTVFQILFLFSVFIFKIVDCIYFMRLQSWRLQTFVRTTKLIIWNTCLLIVLTKYEAIFNNKTFFAEIMENLKLKIIEADFISKLESQFKRSALVDFFSEFGLFLELIYDLYFKALVYICFKFCVLNVLKFFFAVELFFFMLFKHKYTVPYCFVYAGIFFLVFLEYNFFIIYDNKNNNNLNKNSNDNGNKNFNSNKDLKGMEHSGFDFVCFCYAVLFALIGYLCLFLYKLRISVLKKFKVNGSKVQLVFYSVFILGLFFLIELVLKIIKLKGNLIDSNRSNKNNENEYQLNISLSSRFAFAFTLIILGSFELFGRMYLELFYRDYLKEYFPIEPHKDDFIFHFTKRVQCYKKLKLGIAEWKF